MIRRSYCLWNVVKGTELQYHPGMSFFHWWSPVQAWWVDARMLDALKAEPLRKTVRSVKPVAHSLASRRALTRHFSVLECQWTTAVHSYCHVVIWPAHPWNKDERGASHYGHKVIFKSHFTNMNLTCQSRSVQVIRHEAFVQCGSFHCGRRDPCGWV